MEAFCDRNCGEGKWPRPPSTLRICETSSRWISRRADSSSPGCLPIITYVDADLGGISGNPSLFPHWYHRCFGSGEEVGSGFGSSSPHLLGNRQKELSARGDFCASSSDRKVEGSGPGP